MGLNRTSCFAAALLALTCLQPEFARNQREVTRNFDRTVALPPGRALRVESKFGEVKIRGAAQHDVVVHAVIRTAAGSQSEASDLLEKVRIEVDQTATGVNVRTVFPSERSGWFNIRNASYSVNLDITYPETATLEARNDFGDLRVSECKGGSHLVTGHGALVLRNGRGAQRLENSFGAVDVSNNDGDVSVANGNGAISVSGVSGRVNVKNRFGRISVNGAEQGAIIVNSNGAVSLSGAGATSSVTNSFGAVSASGVHGDLTIRNSNGAIDAQEVNGSATLVNSFGAISASRIGKALDITGSNGAVHASRVGGGATIRNSFGATEIQEAGAIDVASGNGAVKASGVRGAAKVRTSFGGITLENVGGAVDASNSNGSITVLSSASGGCQPIVLKTSFGPVKLYLPAGANYNVTATTSFGGINTDFPVSVAGQTSSEAINGRIGNGGCELRITNSNGRIDILKR
jgi:hypothetical protein